MSPICIHFLKFAAGMAAVIPGTVASLAKSVVSSKYCTSFAISICRIVGHCLGGRGVARTHRAEGQGEKRIQMFIHRPYYAARSQSIQVTWGGVTVAITVIP